MQKKFSRLLSVEHKSADLECKHSLHTAHSLFYILILKPRKFLIEHVLHLHPYE